MVFNDFFQYLKCAIPESSQNLIGQCTLPSLYALAQQLRVSLSSLSEGPEKMSVKSSVVFSLLRRSKS